MARDRKTWMRSRWLLVLALAVCLAGTVEAIEIERISVGPSGEEGDGASMMLGISKNGRYLAFQSWASNLVPGDTNDTQDVFLHDRKKDVMTRVSVSSEGVEGNGRSWAGGMSHNGRYVVFYSEATNLVPGDTNGVTDVFVHDRKKGRTTRVSVSSSGEAGDGASSWPTISGNGRYLAFTSAATNLVPGDTNEANDIFVHDRKKGVTERVSVTSSGAQTSGFGSYIKMCRKGRYVCWRSRAPDLVPGDTNGVDDLFVRDRKKGTTERISVSSTGQEGDLASFIASVGPRGRYILFTSEATTLVPGDTNESIDVFVRDRKRGTTTRLSVGPTGEEGDSNCFHPNISPAGRYFAFVSWSTNLVPGVTNGLHDIYLFDRRRGVLTRASMTPGGDQIDGDCWRPWLSKKAKYMAFDGFATNLVPGDTNGERDVFLMKR
jgi:Tol biopolymer transport system component